MTKEIPNRSGSGTSYSVGTGITAGVQFINLILGIGTSVILARILGPEGRGIYALAMLLPSIIVTFGNLGIGPATVYFVARGEFRKQEILGNNVLLSIGISSIGVLLGLVIILFFRKVVFPGVDSAYLLLALILVPIEFFSLMLGIYCLEHNVSKSLTIFN